MNTIQLLFIIAIAVCVVIAAVLVWANKGTARGVHIVKQTPVTQAGKKKTAAIFAAPVTGTKYPRTRSLTSNEKEFIKLYGLSMFYRFFQTQDGREFINDQINQEHES